MAFLDKKELNQAYAEAQAQARKFFEPFDEFERLAANRIRADLPAHYPRVNDGGLAGSMLENAKRWFPELFKGKFVSTDRTEAWLPPLLDILWTREIVPNAETDADLYTKIWNMFYRAEQTGGAAALSIFTRRGSYVGTDLILPYIRDVILEPGKVSDLGSNYIFLNTYHSKLDIKNIIESAEAEEKKAKAQGRKSFNTWDIAMLKELIDTSPEEKEALNKNLSEREKAIQATQYKLVTAFHRGYNAPFFTFIPSASAKDDESIKLARTRKNENPTGDIPLTLQYHVQDLINPYGKGVVELAGPNQNVIDHLTQADVLATQKGLSPPIKIGGSRKGLVMSSIVHAPDARWKIGEAQIDTVDTHTSVYTAIGERISRYRTSQQNLSGSFDGSIPAGSGDATFSKTPAGVQRGAARGSVNDQFTIRMGKNAFRRIVKNQINIYIANRKTDLPFDLMEDEIERLEKAGWPLNGSKQILVEFSKIQGKFDFIPDEDNGADEEERTALAEGIKLLSERPETITAIESQGKFKVDLGEALRQYFAKLNISQAEKIIIPIAQDDDVTDSANETQPESAEMGPAPTPGEAPQQQEQQPPKPSVSVSYKDLPGYGQIQAAAQNGIQLRPIDVGLDENMEPLPQLPPTIPSNAAPSEAQPTAPPADDPNGIQADDENMTFDDMADEIAQMFNLNADEYQVVLGALQAGVSPAEITASITKGRPNGQ